MTTQKNVLDLVHTIAKNLRARNITGNQEQEAWWLLETLTNKTETQLITAKTIELSPEQEHTLSHWLEQRIDEKKPLQYILGSVPFCSVDIRVAPPTLIPRQETEEMTSWLIDTIRENTKKSAPLSILDLCCGSGCIGLALAKALPHAQVIGSDIHKQAIELSEKNKAHNNIANISFVHTNLFDKIPAQNQFDIIISNPPYLSEESYKKVSDEIRLWEDKDALTCQNHGMAIYEQILDDAHKYLKKTQDTRLPQIVLEFGVDQYQGQLEKYMQENGFDGVCVNKDMQNKPRWIAANKNFN